MTFYVVRRVFIKRNFRFLLSIRRGFHEDIEYRTKVENLLRRRFFFDNSFSIYGGLNGAYDYGPMGCAIKSNLLDEWRRFFVLEENMYQVDCSTLTPIQVMAASGHLARFTDMMVKDAITSDCYRVDHLIKDHLEKNLSNKNLDHTKKIEIESCLRNLDTMSSDEIKATISKYNIKAPITDNNLTEPTSFNLMFSTLIGPSGNIKGYFP